MKSALEYFVKKARTSIQTEQSVAIKTTIGKIVAVTVVESYLAESIAAIQYNKIQEDSLLISRCIAFSENTNTTPSDIKSNTNTSSTDVVNGFSLFFFLKLHCC